MKKKLFGWLSAILCLIGEVLLSYGFIKWIIPIYAVSLLIILLSFLMEGLIIFSDKKKKVLKSIILSVSVTAVAVGLLTVINNFIFKGAEPVYTVAITLPISGIILGIVCAKATGRKILAPLFSIGLSLIIAVIPIVPELKDAYIKNYSYEAATPVGLSEYTEKEYELVKDADFYVSSDGNDNGDGSFSKPFLTLEKAREAVKELSRDGRNGITVAIKAGKYFVSEFTLTEQDSGSKDCPITYCAYGDGEVILSNALNLDSHKTEADTESEIYSRFPDSVKDKLVCYDLSRLGISADELSEQRLIGSFNTAEGYGINYAGETPVELYSDGKLQTVARYPDYDYTKIGTVIAENEDGHDKYTLSRELTERLSAWASTEGALIYGFFQSDWADSSTGILSFDKESRELVTENNSAFGCIDDAPCYFYNIPEELDCPGEWYIDTENMLLYYYPGEGTDTVELSAIYDNIIRTENADYITFRGFTFEGSCTDALNLTGNNCTVTQCKIQNVGGNAVIADGYNNLISDNEITATGKGGIILRGGDRVTLEYGNSKADNNYIHDWAVIFRTYSPAVTLEGVGNICSHNEICNTAHEAITFKGNCHSIEYNNIHDVCLTSNDAGAVYSGLHWDWYGTQIRYNCIYNLGGEDYSPAGIYLDDALSGITVYGNLLVNVPRAGIQIGGGRDNDIQNNIIVNTNVSAIDYDQRAIDAFSGGWFQAFTNKDGDSWTALLNSPYKSEIWQEKFPEMASFSEDENDLENPGFVCNPAGSTVKNNVIVNLTGEIGSVGEKVIELSTVTNNLTFVFKECAELFTDYEGGNYSLSEASEIAEKIPEFESLPISEMGRY